MRGGPSSCMSNRHVKRGDGIIVFEEMTNLYGWSMSQFLPTGGFHEIDFTKKNGENVSKKIVRNSR